MITVFRLIVAPGARADNGPLSYLKEYKSGLTNTSTLSAENVLEIGSGISEIWSGKVKSQRARLFKRAHLFGKIVYFDWVELVVPTARCGLLETPISRKWDRLGAELNPINYLK